MIWKINTIFSFELSILLDIFNIVYCDTTINIKVNDVDFTLKLKYEKIF
jgi:hypothetical protein